MCVANGEKTPILLNRNNGGFSNEAVDNWVEIPAVSTAGGAPLQTFAELIGADQAIGARTNDLSKACSIK